MTNNRISWSAGNENAHNVGLDRGMFYIPNQEGIPWNGLISVTESSPNSVIYKTYQDGQRVLIRCRDLEYEARVQAFTYPNEFEVYFGRHPSLRSPFSFSYRTLSSDTTYRIHLVYNVVAAPSDIEFSTISDEIDPTIFEWTFTTRPVKISGRAVSNHIILDSRMIHSWTLAALEDQLYGSEGVISHMPSPEELEEIFEQNAILKVVDNGDGTATITGPDEAVYSAGSDKMTVDWISVVQTSPTTIDISSY